MDKNDWHSLVAFAWVKTCIFFWLHQRPGESRFLRKHKDKVTGYKNGIIRMLTDEPQIPCIVFGMRLKLPVVFDNLFRVENDKLAEHWGVMDTLAPESDCVNSKHKF